MACKSCGIGWAGPAAYGVGIYQNRGMVGRPAIVKPSAVVSGGNGAVQVKPAGAAVAVMGPTGLGPIGVRPGISKPSDVSAAVASAAKPVFYPQIPTVTPPGNGVAQPATLPAPAASNDIVNRIVDFAKQNKAATAVALLVAWRMLR